jgi:O-antigen/teichoic acid export membrane protein
MASVMSRLIEAAAARFPALAGISWSQASRWVESFLSLGAIALFQIVGFIILARSLGVEAYGVVIAIGATVGIAVEFVGLGGGDILVRSVARDATLYARHFGQNLVLIAITIPIVLAAALAGQSMLFALPVSFSVIVLLTASDIVTGRTSVLAEQIAIAHRAIRVANAYRFLAGALRASTIAIACFLFGVRTLEQWWPWQLGQAALGVALYGAHVIWRFGKPQFHLEARSVRDGLPFALNQIFRASQSNIDRMVIGTFGNTSVLGLYGAATRLVQVAMLPVQAMFRMTYPSYFERGRDGMPATWAFAWRLFPFVFVMSIGIAITLLIASEFVVPILGPQFRGSDTVIRWLAPLPILVSIQYIFADALTGADYQALRTTLLAAGLLLNGLFMALGVVWFGTPGIIAAVLLSNACLMLMIVACAKWLTMKTGKGEKI